MNVLRGLMRMLLVIALAGAVGLDGWAVWITNDSEYDKKLGPFIVAGSVAFLLLGGLLVAVAMGVLAQMGQPGEKKP